MFFVIQNYINGAYLHDAVVTYAYALNNTRAVGNSNFGNGTILMTQVIDKKFKGEEMLLFAGHRHPINTIDHLEETRCVNHLREASHIICDVSSPGFAIFT